MNDGEIELASKAIRPMHVRNDPLTHPISDLQIGWDPLARSPPPNNLPSATVDLDWKGDLIIHGLYTKGTDYILDMCVVKKYAVSYVQKTPQKRLQTAEKKKT